MKAAIILVIGFLLIGLSHQRSIEDIDKLGDEVKQIKVGFILDKAFYKNLDLDDLETKQYCNNLVEEANLQFNSSNISIILSDVLIWKHQNEIPIINDTTAMLQSLRDFSTDLHPARTRLDSVILFTGRRVLEEYSLAYLTKACLDSPRSAVIRYDSVQAKPDAMVVADEIRHLQKGKLIATAISTLENGRKCGMWRKEV